MGVTGSGGQFFACVSNLALAPWKGFVYLKWFMNDELSQPPPTSTPRRPLEQRLAHRPAVLDRLHQLADTLDQSVGDDCTADQAEERVSEQVRQLALEVLGQWAREANTHTQAEVPRQHPSAIQHGKKNAEVADHLRLGRRGGGAMATGPARPGAATFL